LIAATEASVARAESAAYPMTAPFDPDYSYPEYPWKQSVSLQCNHAYAAVRRSLELLGLDGDHLGTGSWNPLRDTVKPGDLVLLKPNLVCENREGRADQWEQIVTSASVVRAVLDYVLIALSSKGRVIIADSPQTDSDFDLTVERTGLKAMAEELGRRSCVPIELLDLRKERWIVRDGVCTGSIPLPGDPLGAIRIDLGRRSHFTGSPGTAAFYGASYDSGETNRSHSGGRHVYEICGTALTADVIINLPKLKTHKKCGMTGCLKGMVGLAGNKNFLPHYRFGSPSKGGDQFPDGRRIGPLENLLVSRAKRLLLNRGRTTRSLIGALKPLGYGLFGSTRHVVRSGNWSGNDTIWRTVLDLATILTYCDSSGALRDTPARRFFNFVDGIVAGEGNGPLDAEPNPSRLLVAGASPLVVDAVSAAIAGLDPHSLPLIENGFSSPFGLTPCNPDGVRIRIHPDGARCEGLDAIPAMVDLIPHFGWRRTN
jgi:uncharacterized protein (DUF362 family)